MSKIKTFLFDEYWVLIILVIGAVLYFSLSNFLTKPKLWVDEANTIEQASNLSQFETLDIRIAPGQFSGVPYLIQSTGYPVTAPLALVFKTFGYGFSQARVYMLVWLVVALLLVFYIGREFFGKRNALFSFLLIASFASFYGSGLTVVGEIPGFVFLIIGLRYLWKESYLLSGLILGLAVVTKPSVFELVIPAIIIALLIERASAVKRIVMLLVGMIPAAVLWFSIVVGSGITTKIFTDILHFYLNTYGTSVSQSISSNLQTFFHTPTLIYFMLLLAVVAIARFSISKASFLYDFTIIYSILAFLYYLRSPGWLRYVLIAELLILFLLPHATFTIFERYLKNFRIGLIDWQKACVAGLILLVCIQLAHFATGAKLFYSRSEIDTAGFLNTRYPNDSVAVYNSLALAVLIDRPNRYQVVGSDVIPVYAVDKAFVDPKPLSIQPPIDILVIPDGQQFTKSEDLVLKNAYAPLSHDNEYFVYMLKSLLPNK